MKDKNPLERYGEKYRLLGHQAVHEQYGRSIYAYCGVRVGYYRQRTDDPVTCKNCLKAKAREERKAGK